MPFFSKFFGNAGSEAAGIAIGATAIPSLRPGVQYLENEAWENFPDKPPTIYTIATMVAEGKLADKPARKWARQQGFNDAVFDSLVAGGESGAEFGNLLNGLRRGEITEAKFRTGLTRLGIQPEWHDLLVALARTYLSPSEAANARQQEFITATEQLGIAAKYGIEPQDAEVQFKLAGLPPGVETALQMLRRAIITEQTFAQIVAEGHTKTKYTDELLELRHQVLSAAEYATLHLKGWISEAEMNAGGELTGFTPEQMHLLYLGRGRPAAPGQMATAAARGIDGPAGRPVDEAQFIEAIKQSDIRPEYGPMLWEARYLYPPLFQLSRLVTAGAIDADTAAKWARFDRYPPEVVSALHAFWSKGTTGTADPHVAKAENQLWTTLHKSYVNGEADTATATSTLGQIGVAAGAEASVLELWDAERALIRKQLTPAQIKRAYTHSAINEATGEKWTRDEAIAALVALGYAPLAAGDFLNL